MIELAQATLDVLVLNGILIVHLVVLVVVKEGMIGIVGKEDAHDEGTIVQIRNARGLQIGVQLGHVRLRGKQEGGSGGGGDMKGKEISNSVSEL